MVHFLLVILWTQVSISNGFRDIPPQISSTHRHNAKSSLRMRVSRDVYPYVKCKYIFQFPTPTLPLHYVTVIGLRWRISNKECSLSGPLMLKAKLSEKFSVQKFAKFWPFRGPGDQGVWKVAIFTAKGTSLRESTSIELFCVKIGYGVWPPLVSRKKSESFGLP